MQPQTNGAGNGAAGKPSLPQQPPAAEGRKLSHPAKSHSTRRIPEEKLERLKKAMASGLHIKQAAKRADMGYSTAQRYLRAQGNSKKSGPAAKSAKSSRRRGFRIPPATIEEIKARLAAGEKPTDIARVIRPTVHLSSVYHYQKMMKFEGTKRRPHTDVSEGRRPLMDMAGYSQANKRTWEDIWDRRRPGTLIELRWLYQHALEMDKLEKEEAQQ